MPPRAARLHALRLSAAPARTVRRLRDAASIRCLPGLVREFAEGGVVIQSEAMETVVQMDGDVQIRLSLAFRKLSPEEQKAAIEAHLTAVRLRLAPLVRMANFGRGLRTTVRTVSSSSAVLVPVVNGLSLSSLGYCAVLVASAVFPNAVVRLPQWFLLRLLQAQMGRTKP